MSDERPGESPYLAGQSAFGGCFGKAAVLVGLGVGAIVGYPLANVLGMPPVEGKVGLLVYGLIGLAAVAIIGLPIFVVWYLRKGAKRAETVKRVDGGNPQQ